jgi:hypothetical protein
MSCLPIYRRYTQFVFLSPSHGLCSRSLGFDLKLLYFALQCYHPLSLSLCPLSLSLQRYLDLVYLVFLLANYILMLFHHVP